MTDQEFKDLANDAAPTFDYHEPSKRIMYAMDFEDKNFRQAVVDELDRLQKQIDELESWKVEGIGGEGIRVNDESYKNCGGGGGCSKVWKEALLGEDLTKLSKLMK